MLRLDIPALETTADWATPRIAASGELRTLESAYGAARSRERERLRRAGAWNTGSWIYGPDLSLKRAYAAYVRNAWPGTAVLINQSTLCPRSSRWRPRPPAALSHRSGEDSTRGPRRHECATSTDVARSHATRHQRDSRRRPSVGRRGRQTGSPAMSRTPARAFACRSDLQVRFHSPRGLSAEMGKDPLVATSRDNGDRPHTPAGRRQEGSRARVARHRRRDRRQTWLVPITHLRWLPRPVGWLPLRQELHNLGEAATCCWCGRRRAVSPRSLRVVAESVGPDTRFASRNCRFVAPDADCDTVGHRATTCG